MLKYNTRDSKSKCGTNQSDFSIRSEFYSREEMVEDGLGCRERIKKRKRGGGGKRTNVAGVKYSVANHETAGKCITNTAE